MRVIETVIGTADAKTSDQRLGPGTAGFRRLDVVGWARGGDGKEGNTDPICFKPLI